MKLSERNAVEMLWNLAPRWRFDATCTLYNRS